MLEILFEAICSEPKSLNELLAPCEKTVEALWLAALVVSAAEPSAAT